MPVNPTYPGLYIEELPSSARTITPAPTSVTAFVGYTHPFQGQVAENTMNGVEDGWGRAVEVFSFTEYERMFGGLYDDLIFNASLPNAVYQFFLNGGTDAFVVPLKPRYTPSGVGAARTDIVPAATAVAGIKFVSRQLTDTASPISITIRNINGDAADILITYSSTVELWRGVKVAAGVPSSISDSDFIEKRLASSTLVTVEPAAGGVYPAKFPAPPAPSGVLSGVIGTMAHNSPTGGTTLSAQEFIDVFDADSSLDKVAIFNLLVIPGVTDTSVWSAALDFCDAKRAFFIMDPAISWSADDTYSARGMTKVADQVGLVPHDSPNGALYFPYLKTVDPMTGRTVEQPPSGFVAGVMARTDASRGVWKAPAGFETTIRNTTGVVDSGKMTDMRHGTVNALGVNVLRSFPGTGTVVWGARTLGTSPALEQWRYVPVRRMALFIEQSLLRNLGWVVFEPNDEPLWSAIRISIEGFLLSLFRQSAFQGSTPSQAFIVQCDHTTTTDVDIALGRVNIVVGFRPLKPAEFVVIKISQLAGQVQ
jgi:phage tail sheath protein FI